MYICQNTVSTELFNKEITHIGRGMVVKLKVMTEQTKWIIREYQSIIQCIENRTFSSSQLFTAITKYKAIECFLKKTLDKTIQKCTQYIVWNALKIQIHADTYIEEIIPYERIHGVFYSFHSSHLQLKELNDKLDKASLIFYEEETKLWHTYTQYLKAIALLNITHTSNQEN